MIIAALRRLLLLAGVLVGSASAAAPEPGFGTPERVTLRGYDGDAMEPFLTRDGRYLLFNNRNDPAVDTNLHAARRIDDLTFDWIGELAGANSRVLDGVPSTDDRGDLYFVSMRSYGDTLSTVYRARFADGTVSGVDVVDGVSMRLRGTIDFDAEISTDGRTLYFAEGRFTGGAVPRTADIHVAVREGDRFRRVPGGIRQLAAINTPALEYAPSLSIDLLEIFFTRLDRGSDPSAQPGILRAVRRNLHEPFGQPGPVPAITGFAEAPALSVDGRLLYFHRLESGRFVLYMSRRQPQPTPTKEGETQ